MCPKKSAAIRSAAEQHDVGWPLPAFVVEAIEWILSWFATRAKTSGEVELLLDLLAKVHSGDGV